MRILFVSANPDWTPRLDLLDELRELKQSLKGKEYFLELLPAAQPEDLRDAIDGSSADIDILHFSGHGTKLDGLLFRQSNGRKTSIKASDLNELFKNKPVKLAVLNACDTKATGEGITGFANTVIGTTTKLHEASAKKLTKVLYAALGNGKSIDDAFKEATDTLEKTGLQNIYERYRAAKMKPAEITFDPGDLEVDKENEDAWNRHFFEGYISTQIESQQKAIKRNRQWAWGLLGAGGLVAILLSVRYSSELGALFSVWPDLFPDTDDARKTAYEDWVSFSGEPMLDSITKFGNALPALFAGLKGRLVTHGKAELRTLTRLLELVKSSDEMPETTREKLFGIVEQNMFGALPVTNKQLEKEVIENDR